VTKRSRTWTWSWQNTWRKAAVIRNESVINYTGYKCDTKRLPIKTSEQSSVFKICGVLIKYICCWLVLRVVWGLPILRLYDLWHVEVDHKLPHNFIAAKVAVLINILARLHSKDVVHGLSPLVSTFKFVLDSFSGDWSLALLKEFSAAAGF